MKSLFFIIFFYIFLLGLFLVDNTYEKKLSDWTAKYGDCSERDIESQKGIKERIQDGKKRMRDNDKISNVTRKKSIER